MGIEKFNSGTQITPQEDSMSVVQPKAENMKEGEMAEEVAELPEEVSKKFESAKDFSKETQQDERKHIAESIRSHRKEYFSKQEETKNKLENLVAEAEAKKINAEEVRNKIEETEKDIEQSSKNFIRRLLDRNKLRRLEAELGTAKVTEGTITEELAELETAKMELEKTLQDRTALDVARTELNTFYKNTEKTWNEYEEDRVVGNVKNIMRERNAFMVHAFINPTLSPSDENGLMRKELSWRDKLDLLVLEPTLSASAVDKNHDKTFAPVGVILANGQVESASSGDMGTRSIDVKNRTLRNTYNNPRIGEQIDDALDPEQKRGWTEFVVSEPKIAGVFFKVESDGTLSDITMGSDANMQDIVNFTQERKMPLFVLRDGEFYSITPEEALTLADPIRTEKTERVGLSTYTRKFVEPRKLDLPEDRQLTGQDAAELPECIDDDQKEAILERLMTDSPFQLKRVPEAQMVASRAEGRSLYHLYSNLEGIEASDKKKVVIPPNSAGNVDPLEVTILKSVDGPTHIQNFVELDDGTRAIWYQSRKPVSQESRFRAGSTYRQDWLNTKNSSIVVGQSYMRQEKPIQSVSDIIEMTKKEVENIKGWIEKWEKDGANLYAEQNRNWIKNIAFSLYGMAEEAKSVGDDATVELVQKTVGEFLSEEEYQSLIARRVSETGTVKLTREELTGEKKE